MWSYLSEKVAAPVYKTEINGRRDPLRLLRDTPPAKAENKFVDKGHPLGRYSSLAN
jgi:hypothetical protein